MNVHHQRGNNLRGKDPKSQWVNAHFEKDAENKQTIYLDKKALLSMEPCTPEDGSAGMKGGFKLILCFEAVQRQRWACILAREGMSTGEQSEGTLCRKD